MPADFGSIAFKVFSLTMKAILHLAIVIFLSATLLNQPVFSKFEPGMLADPPALKPLPKLGNLLRTWTDLQGNTLEASLFGATEDVVWLQGRDGEIVAAPLLKLSPEDNEYVRGLNPAPPGQPADPPSVRTVVNEKRSSDLHKEVQQVVDDLSTSGYVTDYDYKVTRSALSYIFLALEFSTGQPCQLEVRFYSAEEKERYWDVQFLEYYTIEVDPAKDRITKFETRPLPINLRQSGDQSGIPKAHRKVKIYPRDWVVGVYWRDEQNRPYLIYSRASDRGILNDEETEGLLARAVGEADAPANESIFAR